MKNKDENEELINKLEQKKKEIEAQRRLNDDFLSFLNSIKPHEFCNIVEVLITVINHFTGNAIPSKFITTETKFYLVSLIKCLVRFAGEEVVVNRFSVESQLTIFEIMVEAIGNTWNFETKSNNNRKT